MDYERGDQFRPLCLFSDEEREVLEGVADTFRLPSRMSRYHGQIVEASPVSDRWLASEEGQREMALVRGDLPNRRAVKHLVGTLPRAEWDRLLADWKRCRGALVRQPDGSVRPKREAPPHWKPEDVALNTLLLREMLGVEPFAQPEGKEIDAPMLAGAMGLNVRHAEPSQNGKVLVAAGFHYAAATERESSLPFIAEPAVDWGDEGGDWWRRDDAPAEDGEDDG